MRLDRLVIILGALLFLSLSCNLFLAGLMVGQSYSRADADDTPDAKPALQPPGGEAEWRKKDEQLRQKLSPADRAILEAAKKSSRPAIETLKQKLDAAKDNLQAAQNAEPFDQAALDAAVAAESAAKAQLLSTLRDARQQVMQQLSPEGRETLKNFAPWKRNGDNRNGRQRWRDHAGQARPEGDPPPPPDYDQQPPQPAPAQLPSP